MTNTTDYIVELYNISYPTHYSLVMKSKLSVLRSFAAFCSEELCMTMEQINLERVRRKQNILRWTIPGPDSSYSCFEHHIFWNVLREAKIDPPIQTEYLRSGGAITLTLYASWVELHKAKQCET